MNEQTTPVDRVTDLVFGDQPWTWVAASELAGGDPQAILIVLQRIHEMLSDEQMPEGAREEAETWRSRLTRRYQSVSEPGESTLP